MGAARLDRSRLFAVALICVTLSGLLGSATPAMAEPLLQRMASLSPTSGPPGTRVTVSGSGWTHDSNNKPYEIRWKEKDGALLGKFRTDADGNFSKKVTIPPSEPRVGERKIWVCEGCRSGSPQTEFWVGVTFTVTPWPTPEPLPTPTDVPTVCDFGGAPGELLIDFESFSEGESLRDVTVLEEVTFFSGADLPIITPSVETHSPNQALSISHWVEFGSNLPIMMRFNHVQNFVGTFVGINEGTWADEPFTATLTAYGYACEPDENGAFPCGVTEVGAGSVTIGPDITPIKECLSVEAPYIVMAAVDYVNVGEPQVMDDLVIRGPETPVPVPEDDDPPVVDIEEPEENLTLREPFYHLSGTITEYGELDHTEVWLNFEHYEDITAVGFPPNYVFRMDDISSADLRVYENNFIEVRAYNTAGLMGKDIVRFYYSPPPTPTPTPSLDIIAEAVEITQVIQCLHHYECIDNSVPFYMGKPTLIRFYVRAEGTAVEVPRVTGELCYGLWEHGSFTPANCLQSLQPVTVSNSADPVRDYRGDLNRTLNFIFPHDWTSKKDTFIRLKLVVNPEGRDAPECCLDNNTLWQNIVFRQGKELNIIAVRANVDGKKIREDQIIEGLQWILRYYPTSDIDIYFHSCDPISASFDFNNYGWWHLLVRLDWIRFWTDEGCDRPRYIALLDPAVNSGNTNGMAWLPENRVYARSSAAKWGTRGGSGDTAGHEVMHNHGLKHAPGGCNESGVNSGYPDYTDPYGVLNYHSASIGEWGINLHTAPFTLYDPTTTPDIMSYCSGRWMSLYTYETLGSALDRVGELGPERTVGEACLLSASEGEVLVGMGYITPDEIHIDSDTLYRTPLPEGEIISADTGPYTVELSDQEGELLYTQAFGPTPDMNNPEPEQGGLFLVIPWAEGTREVVFRYQGNPIGKVSVSAQVPEVALLNPNGGETFPEEGMYEVAWQASDADGDDLLALLQYSPDAGVSWQAVAFDIENSSVEIDVKTLPGSTNAYLRVCVSDGVNTACDTSDESFAVPMKGPQVFVTSPDEGAAYPRGEWVVMQGIALDREDGSIPDGESYIWHSDLDGDLGTGRALWGLPLSVGRHVLTLRTADSDGNAGSASVEIIVGEEFGVGSESSAGESGEIEGPQLLILIFILALVVLGMVLILVAWLWIRKRPA